MVSYNYHPSLFLYKNTKSEVLKTSNENFYVLMLLIRKLKAVVSLVSFPSMPHLGYPLLMLSISQG